MKVSRMKFGIAAAFILGLFCLNFVAVSQSDPGQQTDLTIVSVVLPETTTPGAEFGSQTRVTIYNQGTTIIEGGFFVEMVISSDRDAPIAVAEPTTTFVEDGLLPNGRVEMPTIVPESTYTFTIPGMTMVTDAPLDELVFICAVVDPEDNIDEEWRGYPDGYGVNKLCMYIDVMPGSGEITTPPADEPPSEEPPADEPPSNEPPTRTISENPQLVDYDEDGDCVLSDVEFFVLVDDWTSETAANMLFFEGIDAWMGQRNICPASADLAQFRVEMTPAGVVFVSAQAVPSLTLGIYDLSGRQVFSQSTSGMRLIWNFRDKANNPVANGVYFAQVHETGQIVKLAVVR